MRKIPKQSRSHLDNDFKVVFMKIQKTATPAVDTTLIKFIFKYLQLGTHTILLPGVQFKYHEQKTCYLLRTGENLKLINVSGC